MGKLVATIFMGVIAAVGVYALIVISSHARIGFVMGLMVGAGFTTMLWLRITDDD